MKTLEKWWFWFGLSFMIYANTLNHEYTIDDLIVVTSNKLTQEGISGIPEIFSHSYLYGYDGREDESYRPLTLTTFALEKSLFDAKPATSHFVQVMLYAICMLVLFKYMMSLFGESKRHLVSAILLLFILHPIHTEVVANVKSRDELLSALFLFSSLLMFMKWFSSKQKKQLILSLIFFLAACLSKETAVLGILLFPASLYFTSALSLKEIVRSSIWFVLPFVLYFGLRMSVLSDVLIKDPIDPVANSLALAENFSERFGSNLLIFGKYIQLALIPYELSWDYSVESMHIVRFVSTFSIIGLILLLLIISALIYGIVKRHWIGFGALVFISTFALTSNFFFLINCTLGERFLFIPVLGILIMVVPMIHRLIEEQKQSTKILLLSAVAFLFMVRTVTRNFDWKNNLSIYEAGIRVSPRSVKTHFNLGTEYLEQGVKSTGNDQKVDWFERAADQLSRAKELYPRYVNTYENLGFVYAELGKLSATKKDSISAFKKGKDELDFAINTLGLTKPSLFQNKFYLLEQLIRLSETDSAKEAYKNDMVETVGKIKEKTPEDYQRAIYYSREINDDVRVIAVSKELLSAFPDKKDYILQLSEMYFKEQKFEQSLQLMTIYVDQFPADLSAKSNRGMLLEITGEKQEALQVYEEILAKDPTQEHTRQLYEKLKTTL